MYVKKALIEHEMTRIRAVSDKSRKVACEQAKIKLDLLHALDILDIHEYLDEVERIDAIIERRKRSWATRKF